MDKVGLERLLLSKFYGFQSAFVVFFEAGGESEIAFEFVPGGGEKKWGGASCWGSVTNTASDLSVACVGTSRFNSKCVCADSSSFNVVSTFTNTPPLPKSVSIQQIHSEQDLCSYN